MLTEADVKQATCFFSSAKARTSGGMNFANGVRIMDLFFTRNYTNFSSE